MLHWIQQENKEAEGALVELFMAPYNKMKEWRQKNIKPLEQDQIGN